MDAQLRLGTRGSPLALAQAHAVARALESVHGWAEGAVAIVPVVTTGDRVQDRPLADIGGKALWTKELDRALGAGEVDLCVHSAKDVESVRPDDFTIAATLERADVRDRLIGATSIEDMRTGATVGTSSPRRAAQVRRLRPDVSIAMLRGNVETRLRKVREGEFDATLLAAAGLDRLGVDAGHPVPTSAMLPAPGQAVIAIECRADDAATRERLRAVDHVATSACLAVERAFTRALGASCASPVAALAQIDGDEIAFRAQLLSADGSDVVEQLAHFNFSDHEGPVVLARTMLSGAPSTITDLFEVA
jgi:hydroxymethylbilane synthase